MNTSNVTACGVYTGCNGHIIGGINGFVIGPCQDNVANAVACQFQLGYQPYTNPQAANQSIYAPPAWDASLPYLGAQHISWSNDVNDQQPFFNGVGGSGVAQTSYPLQNELFSGQPTRPFTTYRFIQTHADGQWAMGWTYDPNQGQAFYYWPFCSVSQDGNYAFCSTDWNSAVGFEVPAWKASTNYAEGSFETDPNGNLEAETSASCTSGSSAPAFGTSIGSKIAGDGNCSWTLVELYGYPNTGLLWGKQGTYIAGSYLIDSHGAIEKEVTPFCVSGSAQPTSPTGPGGSVIDGTCSWFYDIASGLSGPPGYIIWTRQDIFGFELQ